MAEESPAFAHLPWTTQTTWLGLKGLQLNKALDQLDPDELSRMTNLVHTGGALQTRPGQVGLGAVNAGTIHSVRRLNVPSAGSFTRFWGAGSTWYRGQGGVLTALEAGFSGNPLTFMTARPPQSGEPWMVAADSNQLRKASLTSPSLPVGLPIPTGLTVVTEAPLKTPIAAFEASDGTQAASWTPFGGPDALFLGAAGPPTLYDASGPSGNCVNMATNDLGTAVTGFRVGMCIQKALNLNVLPNNPITGGPVVVLDDDQIHFDLRCDQPNVVDEIRLYFVCSAFSLPLPAAPFIPGTGGAVNQAAYMRAFRPSDFAAFVAGAENALEAAATARVAANLSQPKPAISTINGVPVTSFNPNSQVVNLATAGVEVDAPSSASFTASDTWTLFGTPGFPLRKSDFLKIGTAGDPGTDWSTITGIYITVQTTSAPITVNGVQTSPLPKAITLGYDDAYLTGGYGPDDSDAAAQPYDYRVIHFDPRTGARSNGSALIVGGVNDAKGCPPVDSVRQAIDITPAAYGPDGNIRQEAYRRGGGLNDNWYFVGVNTANGGLIQDTLSDLEIASGDVVPADHFQPVATTDAAGNTVLNAPVPVVFGPFDDGTCCALGDSYRPGHLYACIAGEIDHWPSTGNFAVEVCPPSEQLMNGCVWAGQGFVLSRLRGYAVHTNLTSTSEGIVVTPTQCFPGLACRWGFVAGPGGIFYVAVDGVRVTQGGESQIVSDQIRSIFHGQTVNGYAPIDWAHPEAIRLELADMDLWFTYLDTNGARQCLVYSLLYQYWRSYLFARVPAVVYNDETITQASIGQQRVIFGSTNQNAYTHEGFDDDHVAITWSCRTGAWTFGSPRQEKLLGDLILEADLLGTTLTVQCLLNVEAVTNAAQTVTAAAGRKRFTFDPFGTTPQHVRSLSVDLSGTAAPAGALQIAYLGVANQIQPEVTMNRPTAWEAPGAGDTEGYVIGCVIDCDTGNQPRDIVIEADLAGGVTTVAVLVVQSDGRHKQWFSWPVSHAQLIRIRPTGSCQPWMLFGVEWLSMPEPPRIAGWDTNWEDLGGDRYYTGLDLECDTFNQPKTVEVFVDQQVVLTLTVQTLGRRIVHVTLPWGRGHLFRFVATDTNPGLLYNHRWWTEPEPTEQTNWNQNFTVWQSLSDKYLKGVVLEADTFGQTKSMNVEVDGVVALVIPVVHTGRSVINYTWPQLLGRVFRLFPTDTNPGRLYEAQPLFDEEPFALGRWETQLLTLDMPGSGWGAILSTDVCYKATAVVTYTISCYNSLGTLLDTLTHTLPATAGAKQKLFVPAAGANKGVLFKFLFTSADNSGITVYEEESVVRVQPWTGGPILSRKPFGNDDLDTTRNMTSAVAAASKSGGGT